MKKFNEFLLNESIDNIKSKEELRTIYNGFRDIAKLHEQIIEVHREMCEKLGLDPSEAWREAHKIYKGIGELGDGKRKFSSDGLNDLFDVSMSESTIDKIEKILPKMVREYEVNRYRQAIKDDDYKNFLKDDDINI